MSELESNAQLVPFPYTGQRYYAQMPADGFLPLVHYKLWAAGGGAGGAALYPGGPGSGGAYVEGIFNVSPGQLIEIFVGQGGVPGATGARAPGGYNGKSQTGYSGGRGGNSGTDENSGSGGGGGGATLMRVDSRIVAIAGAGAGGAGNAGTNVMSNVTATPTLTNKFYASAADQGKGVAGQDQPDSGGGGGGGGGGNAGGEGGDAGSTNSAGQIGHSGSSQQYLNNPADVGSYASGIYPGGYTDIDYPGNNVGFGGTSMAPGGNGYAILTFYAASGIFVKVNGEFKRVLHKLKDQNTFNRRVNSWIKIDGSWRPINANSNIIFSSDNTNWGDSGLDRYTPPPPPPPIAYYYGNGSRGYPSDVSNQDTGGSWGGENFSSEQRGLTSSEGGGSD
jgi:hypothetical protein